MSCINCAGVYPQDDEDRRRMEKARDYCDCRDKSQSDYRIRKAFNEVMEELRKCSPHELPRNVFIVREKYTGWTSST